MHPATRAPNWNGKALRGEQQRPRAAVDGGDAKPNIGKRDVSSLPQNELFSAALPLLVPVLLPIVAHALFKAAPGARRIGSFHERLQVQHVEGAAFQPWRPLERK